MPAAPGTRVREIPLPVDVPHENTGGMLIRRETASDTPAIRAVHEAAFARPESSRPAEAGLVDRLRADDSWLPPLSLVAEVSGSVVGHVVCSRGHVGEHPALGLGPIGVTPDHQNRGIGSALMHAVLAAADATDEPVVALLGEPDYYRRFGFRDASELGITAPVAEWGAAFQARPLTTHDARIRGTFTYAAPFADL